MNTHEVVQGPAFDIGPEELQKPRDECGVFAVWAPGEAVATMVYHGLKALQHRGPNAAGILVHDADFGPTGDKDIGLVETALARIKPDADGISVLDRSTHASVAVGHVRNNTSPDNDVSAAQPFRGKESDIALGHNGHIEGLATVADFFDVDVTGSVSDSHQASMIIDALTHRLGSVDKALQAALPYFDGAYCMTISDGDRLLAVRDPWGFHPLAIGRLPGEANYIVSSEPVAFTAIGAEFLRDVEAGEIVSLGPDGIQSSWIDRPEPKRECLIEYAYILREDGDANGVNVSRARKNMGRFLAEDHPADVDVVIGMPDSGMAAAQGYADALTDVAMVAGAPAIMLRRGIIKNPYVGRSFLQRGREREQTLEIKHRIIEDEVRGKRIALVDDSLIKGNTMRAVAYKLRQAGALEVHLRIAAPPYKNPCFMGLDAGNPDELLARNMTIEEMCEALGVDSIAFNTPERLDQAVTEASNDTKRQLGSLCTACTTGEYPFSVPGIAVPDNKISLGMPMILGKAVHQAA